MKPIKEEIDTLEAKRDYVIQGFYEETIKLFKNNLKLLSETTITSLMPDIEDIGRQTTGYHYPTAISKKNEVGWQMVFFHRKDREPARSMHFICLYNGNFKIILKSRSAGKEQELKVKKDKITKSQQNMISNWFK